MKTYRVYYDRKDEYGVVWWSVDEGDQSTEIKVKGVVICQCEVLTMTANPNIPQKRDEPTGWVEVTGKAMVKSGVCYITPQSEQEN